MKIHVRLPLIIALALATAGCSVVSGSVKSEALAGVSFASLLQDADPYRGEIVILGGYILETENLESVTIIRLLQTPLALGDEPGSIEGSLGRFEVTCTGFLDPELYKKNRRLTVAGKVSGVEMRPVEKTLVPYLQLSAVEIHLWKNYPNRYAYPYPYYGGWYEPYYWRRHLNRRPYRHPHRPRAVPYHHPRRPPGPFPVNPDGQSQKRFH